MMNQQSLTVAVVLCNCGIEVRLLHVDQGIQVPVVPSDLELGVQTRFFVVLAAGICIGAKIC